MRRQIVFDPTLQGPPGSCDGKEPHQPRKMMKRFIKSLALAAILASGSIFAFAQSSAPVQAEEQSLLGILRSNAGFAEKCNACQRLRVIGTENSIEALSRLLSDAQTTQAARYALEGMPFPEAGEALRRALTVSSGNIRTGIADSLGWRKDVAAVPELARLLVDESDPAAANAEVTALGRIGGPAAVEALKLARAHINPSLQEAVQRSLLMCADNFLAANDPQAAAGLFDQLFKDPASDPIRVAAWSGLCRADSGANPERVKAALGGKDEPRLLAALKIVRELNDVATWRACSKDWDRLPAEAQTALIDAGVRFGDEFLPTLLLASRSSSASVRQAVWLAAAKSSFPALIPSLATAAASGDASERPLAREALAMMAGDKIEKAILAEAKQADPAEQVELLVAIGDRGDAMAETLLMKNASGGPEPARLAAIESLGKLALPSTVPFLLNLALKTAPGGDIEPILQALGMVCRNGQSHEKAARLILDRVGKSSPQDRVRLLPLMAELGSPEALQATLVAAREKNPQIVKEAVRVLTQWPNASAATALLELADTASDSTLQVLALRGAIDGLSQETDPEARLAKLQRAMALAKRPEEKRQALGQIGQIPTLKTLEIMKQSMVDPTLVNEAALGALGIAEKLAKDHPQIVASVANEVLAHSQSPELIKRAWTLRGKPPGPFVTSWLAAGPFTESGASSALTLFDVVFAPEKEGAAVSWKPLSCTGTADLSSLFPGELNCVAYMKTTVSSPADLDGMLLLGSDDGLKVWLNGEVVHRANVDRGLVADQDVATIHLRKGPNELLLKVTQGGGGWAACARIVSRDGSTIPGLKTGVSK